MDIIDRLAKSKFRSRFKLRAKELEYINDKGLDKVKSHAEDFIRDRVAQAEPLNDGKQTPMRGHPVFIAQRVLTMQASDYDEFLLERRKMMAEKIKKFYYSI